MSYSTYPTTRRTKIRLSRRRRCCSEGQSPSRWWCSVVSHSWRFCGLARMCWSGLQRRTCSSGRPRPSPSRSTDATATSTANSACRLEVHRCSDRCEKHQLRSRWWCGTRLDRKVPRPSPWPPASESALVSDCRSSEWRCTFLVRRSDGCR